MRFTWDEKKNGSNYAKHGIDFLAAREVFSDPNYLSATDEYTASEERWQTIGLARGCLLLLVVHTYQTDDGEEIVRIISARKATKRERRIYETSKR